MTVVMGAIGFAFLALTAWAVPAAAYSMVAVIETQSQGPLACGNTARGLEGTQTLLGISDEILLPSAEGAGGGDPGGALQVRPVVVIKELDRCTPPLFLALVNRERIRLVEIRLFDRQGVHFFTIRLEDALVTRISRQVRSHGLHEEVAFTYRAIQLIDERSGASASHQFSG
jgi:type VI secretion system secreted protein Hcp